MAEGSAACWESEWGQKMKVGGGSGNGTANMLFLNHAAELWTLASFLPIPLVLFFPHLDPPPWGLH